MTKKKIYGVQPTREPFFRDDERVRGKYRQGPTPLTIPSSPPSSAKSANLANRNARRAASRSRVRSHSVSSKATNNESRPQSRRCSHSRRTSRLSSPESPEDGNLHSPTSSLLPSIADIHHTAHNLASNTPIPLSPLTGSLYAGSAVRTDSLLEMNGTTLQTRDTSLTEPRWPQTSYDSSAHPLLSSAYPSAITCLTQDGDNLITVPSGDHRMRVPAYYNPSVGFGDPPSHTKGHASAGFSPFAPQITLDGNTPFIFSAEAEAQAAARLAEAGLRSSIPSPHLRYPELPPLDNFSSSMPSSVGQHLDGTCL
jgi:hypothetical protein